MKYLVEWCIDIEDATDAVDAAQQAWDLMRGDMSIANCFSVLDVHTGERVEIDLHVEAREDDH